MNREHSAAVRRRVGRGKTRLALCTLTGAIGGWMLPSAPAQAINFEFGEVRGNFDTNVSAEAQMRVEERDKDLVGKANNVGPGAFDVALGGTVDPATTPGDWSVNGDDGNLNYDQWDLISSAVKVNHELSLRWRNYGFFARGFYFYDVTNDDFDEAALDGYPGGNSRPSNIENNIGYDGKLRDAFVYGDFDLGGRFLSARAGWQVVSWGESTFIQNGINIINPVDVTKLRTAGAELKEALVPLPMAWGSLSLTPDLTLEAFYQVRWEETVIDPRGSYFSSSDVVGTGGQGVFLGSGLNDELLAVGPDGELLCDSAIQCKIRDHQPDDDGQWGAALRWLLPGSGSTELGLYYIRHHSRLPIASWQLAGTTNRNTGATAGAVGSVFVEYPEDIELVGVSFNTLLPVGTALQGEVSYTMDAPKQVDDAELVLKSIPSAAPLSQLPDSAVRDDGYISGYRRLDTWQAQVTATHAFGPGWGAAQRLLIAEVGAQYVDDMPDVSELVFNGPGTPRPSPFNASGLPVGTGADPRVGVSPASKFDDDFAWGYVLVGRLEYNNVFGPWSMMPSVAVSHGVNGTTPGPSRSFQEDVVSLSAGVDFTYLTEWEVGFSYTGFFGAGTDNILVDKDFVGIEVNYSF